MILILSSCAISGDTGTNSLLKESQNSRQDKKAILFLKEAGATVSDSYQVVIRDVNYKLDKAEVGDVFTVDPNHSRAQLDTGSINLVWLGNDTLQIDFDKKLRTLIKKENFAGVTIIYQAR
ncbi:MAG: hypothetical protein ABIX01_23730 [Chitinophagaceae bacterium]